MIDDIYIVKLLKELGILPTFTPHGIRLGTTGWRLERGGGIAGNLHTYWLRVIPNIYHPLAPDANALKRGPAHTRRELRELLTQWLKEKHPNSYAEWRWKQKKRRKRLDTT